MYPYNKFQGEFGLLSLAIGLIEWKIVTIDSLREYFTLNKYKTKIFYLF